MGNGANKVMTLSTNDIRTSNETNNWFDNLFTK